MHVDLTLENGQNRRKIGKPYSTQHYSKSFWCELETVEMGEDVPGPAPADRNILRAMKSAGTGSAAVVVLKRMTSRRGMDPTRSLRSDKTKSMVRKGVEDDKESEDEEIIEKRVLDRYADLVLKKHPPIRNIRRLNRKNLVDRLVFEEDLRIGLFQLLSHILVFVFIMETLNISKNVKAMRGIYIDLDNSFDFENLRSISSRDDFILNWIPALSENSKKYFVRGSRYFDTGGAGSVQLHAGTKEFSEPVSLGGSTVSIQLPSFSFTAWVQLSPEFSEGYIFRKRLLPASKTSCWGNMPAL